MRVPLSWLKEYVEILLPPEKIAEQLTFAGLEVEQMDYIGLPAPAAAPVKVNAGLAWDPTKIFVGQLVEVAPHPNADRLTLATVEYGQSEPIRVVTGAPNIKVGDKGQKVALALEGTRLYDGHKPGRELMTLKKSKIRGVESGSMVCSEKELGLSDEHEGIILLPDDAPVGMPLAEYMGDIVFDIKINPNMARAQSVIGIAREVAALTGQRVRLPGRGMDTRGGTPETLWAHIEIADPRLCARYSALLLRDVTLGPAPFWMQRRLSLAGMRPISNIVDITNYVMLEWGQPLHAFDYDKLVARAQGRVPTILVRPTQSGETMRTLDGVDRTLAPTDLLITDTQGPIAVAGVMGGAETEIDATTRNILLEAANFDFISIRRTTQALKLPSEAATRFGRGVAPVLTLPAGYRAADLMTTLASGTQQSTVADNYAAPYMPPTIDLPSSEVARQIGLAIPGETVETILRALDFTVEPRGEGWRLSPPPYRLDVDGTDDVIEEIARIYGYERIPSTLIADALPPLRGNIALEREERVRDLLVQAGLQEIVTYSLTSLERESKLRSLPAEADPAPRAEFDPLPQTDYVRIENPISPERDVMRQTLLAGLLTILSDNWRQRERLTLFEMGPVYLKPDPAHPDAAATLPEDRGMSLPIEPRRLALGLWGRREAATWDESTASKSQPQSLDFYDLKGVLESMLDELHLALPVRYAPAEHPTFHPGRAAWVLLGTQRVGILGELHPVVRRAFDLPDKPVFAAELDFEAIHAQMPAAGKYVIQPLSRYPAVIQDLALVVDESTPAQAVTDLIRQTGGALLTRLDLFDVYSGDPLPAGKKSLAYTLAFQSLERVLSDVEVGKLRGKIVQRAQRELGAEFRSG